MATTKKDAKSVLATAARQATTNGQFKEAMAAMAKIKEEKCGSEDLAWVLANEAAIKAKAAAGGAAASPPGFFPRIRDVKWRVDVTISTSSLERVMRPSVMMQIELDDGALSTFEMPIDQFHKLRFSVARVLRNMQEIERNPIMRLIDQDTT